MMDFDVTECFVVNSVTVVHEDPKYFEVDPAIPVSAR